MNWHDARMTFSIRAGDRLVVDGRARNVTPLDAVWAPRVRDRLVELARARSTTTYGALKEDIGLPHPANGFGRILDLVAEDCRRRGEPRLDALVVTVEHDEVGSGHGSGAAARREEVYAHWA